MENWNQGGDFITQFGHFSGAFGNFYCQAVRDGVLTPKQIVFYVSARVIERILEMDPADPRRAAYSAFAEIVRGSESEDYAQFILRRESLTLEQKNRLKEKYAAEKLRAVMAQDPPTEKQLSYLKSLGSDRTPNSKLEASDLISQLLSRQQT